MSSSVTLGDDMWMLDNDAHAPRFSLNSLAYWMGASAKTISQAGLCLYSTGGG